MRTESEARDFTAGGDGGSAIRVETMLRSATNRALHTVHEDCPVSHAYELFCTMGMRHLVVLALDGTAVGMLTRKDLCHLGHDDAHKDGHQHSHGHRAADADSDS